MGNRTRMADRELNTYLNDHLAGSMAGIELARHAASENDGTPLGTFLAGLADEIEADRNALREIMDSVDVGEDHAKLALAWATEKAARLKFHSPLSSRGPLTTLLELESLVLGITGKLLLWRALAAARGTEPRLEELIARAERQREDVERHRLEAARAALGT
jgi:hypothetical protein